MRGWRWRRTGPGTGTEAAAAADPGEAHLELARRSLRGLIEDTRVPAPVRSALAADYAEVRRMLDKLEQGQVHIAAFGRVGVGKSSLLNALIGERCFSTSPLHGETTGVGQAPWQEAASGGVYLVDTPGIDEVGGEERERMAREAARRADLLLFVAEGDLTGAEREALAALAAAGRPMLLVLNKADHYDEAERAALLARLAQRATGLVDPANIVAASADPAPERVVARDMAGTERETRRRPPPDVAELGRRLWAILEAEGKSLAALNAGLFAGELSEAVGRRIVEARRQAAEKLVRTYCIAKGVAVAFNPLPVADLVAAAAVDAGMVVHLSRLYGLPLSRREAGSLIRVIATQMAALMGTVWAVHLVSSALKVGSAGLSVMLTAGAQGAVAYYSTYVVGRAAEAYLARGCSWGEGGPRAVVAEILESVDRDSVIRQARRDLKARLVPEEAG